jgi:hypothetical protein
LKEGKRNGLQQFCKELFKQTYHHCQVMYLLRPETRPRRAAAAHGKWQEPGVLCVECRLPPPATIVMNAAKVSEKERQ